MYYPSFPIVGFGKSELSPLLVLKKGVFSTNPKQSNSCKLNTQSKRDETKETRKNFPQISAFSKPRGFSKPSSKNIFLHDFGQELGISKSLNQSKSESLWARLEKDG